MRSTYNLRKVRATSWTHQTVLVLREHIVTMIAKHLLPMLRHTEGYKDEVKNNLKDPDEMIYKYN